MPSKISRCRGCGDRCEFRGLDIFQGDTDRFLTWQACCQTRHDTVSEDGFEAGYGVDLLEAIRQAFGIWPDDEIIEIVEWDGDVVARLRVVDPTIVGPATPTGIRQAVSPRGWQRTCFDAVDQWHRHHGAPQGYRFAVAVYNGPLRIGVAIVGRPVSRAIQEAEPRTVEITRVCCWGRSSHRRNAASKLYSAAASRAAQLGADKVITYTIADEESGASLIAAGFTAVHRSSGGSWDAPGRPRQDKAPTGSKIRWERGLTKATRVRLQRQVREAA